MGAQNNRNRKMQDLIGNEHLGRFQEKTMCFMYDFDALGGAASALTLTDAAGNAQQLPDNALITSATWDVTTALASGGSATVALGWTGTAVGILAATDFDHASIVAATQTSSLAINGKMSAATSVLLTIGVAALTAGKMYLYITYVEGF